MKNKTSEKKEGLAIIIGFVLIFLVIVFTLLRGKIFSSADNSNTAQNSKSSNSPSSTPSYKTISARDLNKKILGIGSKDKLTLLDIRPFESYIQEHIVDTVNLTPDDLQTKPDIDPNNLTVVIGADSSDKDIQKALDKLKTYDITNTIVLAGGMDSWKQQTGDTVTFGDPKSFVDQSKVSYTDPEKLNDAIIQKVPIYVVDVRSADDYAKGHVTGAINIPFEELEKRRKEITEKKVVVLGINELQEFQASVQMYDMLLVSPFVVRGAMPAWQQKGFAVVK